MTEWQRLLREHDDVAPLATDDVAAMRRRLVAEALRARAAVPPAQRLAPVFALGAALAVAVAAGLLVARSQPAIEPVPSGTGAPGELRQLQFATPGGTRIIWQFNPEFWLQETRP